MTSHPDEPRRTLILTGASRGIGHATVKRFASAGWRVITCSRHAFPENCPWAAGPEDHIQVDLASREDTLRAIAEMRERLAKDDGGRLNALVNNAAISPKGSRQVAPPPRSGGGGAGGGGGGGGGWGWAGGGAGGGGGGGPGGGGGGAGVVRVMAGGDHAR